MISLKSSSKQSDLKTEKERERENKFDWLFNYDWPREGFKKTCPKASLSFFSKKFSKMIHFQPKIIYIFQLLGEGVSDPKVDNSTLFFKNFFNSSLTRFYWLINSDRLTKSDWLRLIKNSLNPNTDREGHYWPQLTLLILRGND